MQIDIPSNLHYACPPGAILGCPPSVLSACRHCPAVAIACWERKVECADLQELTGYDKQYWGEVADGSREHVAGPGREVGMMSDSLKIVCWNGTITTYRRNAIIPHHVEEAASLVLRVDMEDERPRVTLLKSRYAPSELCPEWQERRKPQVDAKLIERGREALARWAVVGMAPDGERLFHALRDLLAAVEAGDARTPVPPELFEQAQRFAIADESLRNLMPWENMAMERGDVIRDLLPHLRPEAAKPSTPDFAAMSEQERKAWLRERGRLTVHDEIGGSAWARLLDHDKRGCPIATATAVDEPAALLALCEAVAVKERGEDE